MTCAVVDDRRAHPSGQAPRLRRVGGTGLALQAQFTSAPRTCPRLGGGLILR
jgi:hypothetical protein